MQFVRLIPQEYPRKKKNVRIYQTQLWVSIDITMDIFIEFLLFTDRSSFKILRINKYTFFMYGNRTRNEYTQSAVV